MKTARLNIRIDEDMMQWMRTEAGNQRTTTSEILRQLLLNVYVRSDKGRLSPQQVLWETPRNTQAPPVVRTARCTAKTPARRCG
jgi:hypothetical protein